MGKYTTTNQEVIEAVKNSKSLRQTLMALGLRHRGAGNYKVLRKRILDLNLDTSHFLQHDRLERLGNLHVVPTAKYLILNEPDRCTIQTDTLKKRLIRDGFKKAQCESCGIETWLDEAAPLELHHVNCHSYDNRLENLKILCANCHMIEHRRINRLKKGNDIKIAKIKHEWLCSKCGKKVSKHRDLCLDCAALDRRKVKRPSKEETIDLVKKHGYSAVGRMYGVSDNAVRKWIKD